ncbi:PASTA domain-containing protein [Streptomyces agglomeratus]|uniref:PASTA domain-containing protein n=1 Tax=Streptomyces agglomeratus TaxID=285458 RepID=UPI00114CAD0D|nr:PASTA domain-containing protein [Streptomyces agglomeratus]
MPPQPQGGLNKPGGQLNAKHKTILGCGGMLAAFLVVGMIAAAVSPSEAKPAAAKPVPAVTVTATATVTAPPPAKAPKPSPTKPAAPQKARVPDMTGKSGDLLVEALQKAGFTDGYRATSFHDVSGQGRTVFLLTNWQICDQDPKNKTVPVTAKISVGAVKFGETCP